MTGARLLHAACAVALAAAACTEHVQLAPGGKLPGLIALEVSPPSARIELDSLTAPDRTVAFAAIGSFADGAIRDVTALVEWSTDHAPPGRFDQPGAYTATGAAGGHVAIRASSGDVAGTAAVTVVVSGTIVDPAFPPPPELFAPGTPVGSDPMRQPIVRYPADQTRFPQQLARIVFQHDGGTANDAFRLRFDSDVLHLVVLTGTDRWQPDDAAWTLISASHPGGAVTLQLDAAASTMPGTIHAAAPIELAFTRETSRDVVYLFSEATAGIATGSFATTATVELYPRPGDPQPACCHAVSRDGRALAMGYGGDRLHTVALPSLATVIAADRIAMGWAAFSPDGTRLVVADKGALVLRDEATGAPIGPGGGKLPLPMGVKASQPDWSPDGRYLAVVTSDDLTNAEVKRGSIARIAFAGGAWGPVETLVASTGDPDNNFFPRWSPDGRVLAYVHATSSSRDPQNPELRIVAAGGGAPIALARASSRVGPLDGVPDLGSTTPAWTAGSDGALWLTFASTRPYGVVRPMKGNSQIWVAGVDLDRADDPSFAAFWLPCQDLTALAGNPVWAPAPGDGGEGVE